MSILEKIVATTRADLQARMPKTPWSVLQQQLDDAPPPRDFLGAIRDAQDIALIAEVKKASPSKGSIRDDFDPVEIARAYAANGATCISVLTDEPHFQGHLDYLIAVRRSVAVPVLRKDFIVDPYQILEARVAGADAVLLIAECLPGNLLTDLLACVHQWKMTALVELYEPANLERVIASGARLIGINNRDLATFAVDIDHTLRMASQIPSDRCVVAESGIETAADVQRLRKNGIDAMLVGESLMRQPDVGSAVRNLLKPC